MTFVDGEMQRFTEVEDRLMRCIAERFNLSWPMPKVVKEIDTRMVVTEAKVVMKPPPVPWDIDAEPLEIEIVPQTMEQSKLAFLERFIELTGMGGCPARSA